MALLALETVGALVLVVVLVVDLLTLPADSMPTAVAVVVMAAILAVALVAVLVGVWRGRAWPRGLGIVVHLLLAATGVGALQGVFAQPGWGWPLTVAAALGFGLLISPSVSAWLSREDEAA